MWHGMDGRGGGCGPGGRRDRWERFAGRFADRWAEAGRGDGGRGEGGRGRPMFRREELRLVVLKLIADEPRHGYDLIREIEALTRGAYAPSPGVIYPLLALLDEMDRIAGQRSEGAKKRYAITEAGRAELAANAEPVAALLARLAALGAERSRDEGTPIRRAMRNLGVALQHRVRGGESSEDTIHDIAALIDEVAQRIERLR